MRKLRKQSFEDLVLENKKQLLKDQDALNRIEDRLEKKLLDKVE
ncbi:FbpB family small basic protein [Bacillus timonensis]|nr:FbpB family small basic protein [Bacillus timonensis]